MEATTLPATHTHIATAAAARVAAYPQYAPDRYQTWTPLRALRDIKVRGQYVARKGEKVLANPVQHDYKFVTVVTATYPHEVSVLAAIIG